MKECPLREVKAYEINMIPDEKGFFAEALRQVRARYDSRVGKPWDWNYSSNK